MSEENSWVIASLMNIAPIYTHAIAFSVIFTLLSDWQPARLINTNIRPTARHFNICFQNHSGAVHSISQTECKMQPAPLNISESLLTMMMMSAIEDCDWVILYAIYTASLLLPISPLWYPAII